MSDVLTYKSLRIYLFTTSEMLQLSRNSSCCIMRLFLSIPNIEISHYEYYYHDIMATHQPLTAYAVPHTHLVLLMN